MIDSDTIRQLAHSRCYPGNPQSVTLHQTHLSVVCVAGDRAYKLKKPVRLPFVDFSTLELRRHFCEEEVRLNLRLCPDAYLGVVPLISTPSGVSFHGDAPGEVVDYAVLMRRLPAERMMDTLLAQGTVTVDDLETIAGKMAAFHQLAALPGGSPEALQTAPRLREFALANFAETSPHLDSIFDRGLHRLLREQAGRDFDRHMPSLQSRAHDGWVVDGHGDLHCRNICLCEPLAIYDCIEFNRDLRIQDVAAENAFLVMDLHYRGHPELASAYLDHYISLTGDGAQRELVPMLLRYRAMVRAKVAAIAACEQEIGPDDREGCIGAARRHLNLAAASAITEGGSWLVCASGLPGTGKTYVFEALARVSGWPRFSSDVIRKELAGIPPGDHAPAACYTPEFSARTYSEVMRRASAALARGPVLLDANFGSAALRRQVADCARRAGARVVFVWFQADEQEIASRMRERAADPACISDADIEIYRKLKTNFEAPALDEGGIIIAAGSCGSCDQEIANILRGLLEG